MKVLNWNFLSVDSYFCTYTFYHNEVKNLKLIIFAVIMCGHRLSLRLIIIIIIICLIP